MKKQNPYRKFQGQQENIEKLERTNSRFKRVYNEYELMADELWLLETSTETSVPDDFINSVKFQTSCLEDEIVDWLGKTDAKKAE